MRSKRIRMWRERAGKARAAERKRKNDAKRTFHLKKKVEQYHKAANKKREAMRKVSRAERRKDERSSKAAKFHKLRMGSYHRLIRVERCVERAMLGHIHRKKRAARKTTRSKPKRRRAAPVAYQHCDFGGYKKVLRHSTNWVRKLGIKNDDLSSIKVPAGKCVILYQHSHYRGKSWKICGRRTVKCFTRHRMMKGKSWNDQVSSIRVINKRRAARRRRQKAGLMGFREKKNANLLKTFCSLNADKILESSRHFGVLGDLLRAMAVKSKKSGVQQYAAVMRRLRRRNSRGIPRYVLSHIRHKMKWRANGILYPFTKGKTAMTGIQAKMLGFKQNKLGLQKFDTPSKTLIKLLVSQSTKKKKRAAGLKFDAKTFRALKKWTGN